MYSNLKWQENCLNMLQYWQKQQLITTLQAIQRLYTLRERSNTAVTPVQRCVLITIRQDKTKGDEFAGMF